MTRPLPRWLPPAFTAVLVACLQFVVLTLAAMALYPGGTVADPTVARYSFVRNFFSDLGRTVSPLGEPNLAAAVLFAVALALAGAGLALFFLATPWFFTHSRGLGLVSGLGSVFGVLSGLSFMGVAFTPANLLLEAHRWFVLTAFRTFLPPVICYSVAILASRRVPNRFALVYLGFAALLGGLFAAPGARPCPGQRRWAHRPGHRAEDHRLCGDPLHWHPGGWREKARPVPRHTPRLPEGGP